MFPKQLQHCQTLKTLQCLKMQEKTPNNYKVFHIFRTDRIQRFEIIVCRKMFKGNLDTNYGFFNIKYHVLKAQGAQKNSLFIIFSKPVVIYDSQLNTALYLTTAITSVAMNSHDCSPPHLLKLQSRESVAKVELLGCRIPQGGPRFDRELFVFLFFFFLFPFFFYFAVFDYTYLF